MRRGFAAPQDEGIYNILMVSIIAFFILMVRRPEGSSRTLLPCTVMTGFIPVIHDFLENGCITSQVVDGRARLSKKIGLP